MAIDFQTQAEADAEAATIGICLTWPDRVVDATDLRPEHFGHPHHQAIWAAICRLSDAGGLVDVITVADELARMGTNLNLAEVAQYLTRTTTLVSTGDNVTHYTAMIRSSWARRRVALTAAEIVIEAKACRLGGGEILDLLLQRISEVEMGQADEALPMPRLVKERFVELMRIADAKKRGEDLMTGLSTGIKAVDKIIGGLQYGIVTVAAGRPGSGKSSLALTVADSVTASGKGVHVFSMEDIRAAYVDRSISRHSGVPAEKLRACDLTVSDVHSIQRAASILYKRGTWLVDDRSGLLPEEIVRSVRRHRKANATECVVVDYAQIVRGLPRQERFEVVSRAMDIFGDAAKHDKLCYLVLAQLNRDCEKREDKRPLLADLKQSGSIEERSKCVMMLYRDRMYDESAPEDEIEIIIRKNNQGQTGTAVARWNGPTTTISDMEWRSDD